MNSPLRISSLFTAAVLFISFNANAQNNKALAGGNFSIGSGLGYTNAVTNIQIQSAGGIKEGGNTAFQIHLTPTIGYFLTNNIVFGLGMDYLVSSSQNNTPNNAAAAQKTSDTKLLFGPFTRIFFPFAGDQALFFGAVYGYGKSDTEISTAGDAQKVKTTLMTFGAGPGYAIFSNNRVSLDAQAKYNYGISRNVFNVDGASQTTRTLTTAWDFVVGMHFYFSRRSSNSSAKPETGGYNQ